MSHDIIICTGWHCDAKWCHITSMKYSQGLSKASWKLSRLLPKFSATPRFPLWAPTIFSLRKLTVSEGIATCPPRSCCWETLVKPLDVLTECFIRVMGYGCTAAPFTGLLALLFWAFGCEGAEFCEGAGWPWWVTPVQLLPEEPLWRGPAAALFSA